MLQLLHLLWLPLLMQLPCTTLLNPFLAALLIGVIKERGPKRFSAIVVDNAANTLQMHPLTLMSTNIYAYHLLRLGCAMRPRGVLFLALGMLGCRLNLVRNYKKSLLGDATHRLPELLFLLFLTRFSVQPSIPSKPGDQHTCCTT